MDDATSTAVGGRSGAAQHPGKWDFWGSRRWLWDLYERDTVPIRELAVSELDLEPDDAVLDVGCGPGTNVEFLRNAVGPDGSVVALDYSETMVRRTRERVASRGWTNVEVVRADATRSPIAADRFDAALATTSVSATPDVRATVEGVRDALAPGAPFAVYDLRTVPAGPARALNPIVRRLYRAIGDWNAGEDVLDRLERTFGDVTVVETYALGTNYVAVASALERQ